MLFKEASSRIESESSCALWVNPRQYVLKLINKSEEKQLIFASLISPSKKQNSRKLWKNSERAFTKQEATQNCECPSLWKFNGY